MICDTIVLHHTSKYKTGFVYRFVYCLDSDDLLNFNSVLRALYGINSVREEGGYLDPYSVFLMRLPSTVLLLAAVDT